MGIIAREAAKSMLAEFKAKGRRRNTAHVARIIAAVICAAPLLIYLGKAWLVFIRLAWAWAP